MQQKLVTLYMNDSNYSTWGKLRKQHGLVEDQLTELLSQGWKVLSMTGLGGAAESSNGRGWFMILLEREPRHS